MDNELKNNDLDNAFRKAIDSLETEPSDDFWKKAEANIAENVYRKDKKRIVRWKYFSLLLLALLGLSGWYIISLQQEVSEKSLAQHERSSKDFSVPENKTDQPLDKNEPVGEKEQIRNNNSSPQPVKGTLPVIQNNTPHFSTDIPADLNTPVNNKTGNPDIGKHETGNLPQEPETPVAPEKTLALDNKVSEKQPEVPVVSPDSIQTPVIALTPAPAPENPVIPPNKTNRWQLLAYYAPSFTKRELKDNDALDSIDVNDVKDKEKERQSWSAGIKAGYDLSQHWSLQSGLYYNHTSIAIEPTEVTARKGNNGSLNYELVTSTGTVEFVPSGASPVQGDTVIVDDNTYQTIAWLGIPLQFQYRFGTRKVSFYASAGAALNLLVKGETEITVETYGKKQKEKVYSVNGLRDTHYSVMAGLGIRYMPARHLYFFAEPSYKGSLSPINSNAPVKTRPSSIELGFGLGWHF